MSDEYQLAMGGMRGLRVWRLYGTSRLHALWRYSYIWQPGENVAECDRDVRISIGYQDDKQQRRYNYRITNVTYEPNYEHAGVVDENCQCGFYAFTSNESRGSAESIVRMANLGYYLTPQRFVFGVINGWGKTLVGESGFRSEKAEIVALWTPYEGRWALFDEHREGLDSQFNVPLFPTFNQMLEQFPLGEVDI